MTTCVTCGENIGEERAEMGFSYCLAKDCVKANYKGYTVVEIGQTKTNAEYKILSEDTLRDVAEGKFRRDPVVVQRQSGSGAKAPKLPFAPRPAEQYNRARVRYVQALADQGNRVDDIVRKGAYMRLTRQEVIRYMAGKRV